MPGDRPQQPGPVFDLGHHLDPALTQQRHEALTQQCEILGDHYPHGMLISTTVPAPVGLSTVRLPSRASTRARSPASPEPPGSAPPRPSSPTITTSARCSSLEANPAAPRRGVLGGVRERLGDHEVGGALDGRGEAATRGRLDRRAQPVASGERLDGRDQPAIGEQRRHDPPREVTQLGDRMVGLALGISDQPPDLRLLIGAQLGPAQLQRQRDEPRLRSVVQVALDAPQLGSLRVDGLAARAGQQVDPGPQRAPPTGDQHAVVQGDQRVAAARGGQAQQRPRGPELVHARQQPGEQPRHQQDHGGDADERPHARDPAHGSPRMSPRPARREVEQHGHDQPQPGPGRPEVSLSVERPDRGQQDCGQSGEAANQRAGIFSQRQPGRQRRHPPPGRPAGRDRHVGDLSALAHRANASHGAACAASPRSRAPWPPGCHD